MPKRWIIVLAVGILALAWIGVLFVNRDREPSHQRHTLSYWLEQINQRGWDASGEAQDAIRAIGTNAFPTSLKWLSYEYSNSPVRTVAEQRASLAPWVFYILRSNAQPAIPEVVRLARTTSDPERGQRCVAVLANIGPVALPGLLTLASNSPTHTRVSAVGMLEAFGTNAAMAIPVLVSMLTDPEYEVRRATTNELLKIAPEVLTNAPVR